VFDGLRCSTAAVHNLISQLRGSQLEPSSNKVTNKATKDAAKWQPESERFRRPRTVVPTLNRPGIIIAQ